jgi:hypothetical protein
MKLGSHTKNETQVELDIFVLSKWGKTWLLRKYDPTALAVLPDSGSRLQSHGAQQKSDQPLPYDSSKANWRRLAVSHFSSS